MVSISPPSKCTTLMIQPSRHDKSRWNKDTLAHVKAYIILLSDKKFDVVVNLFHDSTLFDFYRLVVITWASYTSDNTPMGWIELKPKLLKRMIMILRIRDEQYAGPLLASWRYRAIEILLRQYVQLSILLLSSFVTVSQPTIWATGFSVYDYDIARFSFNRWIMLIIYEKCCSYILVLSSFCNFTAKGYFSTSANFLPMDLKSSFVDPHVSYQTYLIYLTRWSHQHVCTVEIGKV